MDGSLSASQPLSEARATVPAGRLAKLFEWGFRALEPLARLQMNFVKKLSPSFYKNFYGSDVYGRYTSHYSWCADQAGHFAIGVLFFFVGQTVWAWWSGWRLWVHSLMGSAYDVLATYLSGALATSLVLWFFLYVAKEGADWLIEQDSSEGQKKLYRLFPLDNVELGLDGVTDAGFVLAGVLVGHIASYTTRGWPWPNNAIITFLFALLCFGGLGFALVIRTKHQLIGRDRFDMSGLPDYVRLFRYRKYVAAAQIKACGTPEGTPPKTCAAEFIEAVSSMNNGEHNQTPALVISADPGATGRTVLATAIGCELVIRNVAVRFVACRQVDERTRNDDARKLLAMVEAKVIVVDDIELGTTGPDRLVKVAEEIALARVLAKNAAALVMVLIGDGTQSESAVQEAAANLRAHTQGPVFTLRVGRTP